MTNIIEITLKLQSCIEIFHLKTLRYHYYSNISSCGHLEKMEYDWLYDNSQHLGFISIKKYFFLLMFSIYRFELTLN